MSEPETTPDGRYLLIRGRRWRASDPLLPDRVRERLVRHLMSARRAVAAARRAGDPESERGARQRVGWAKQGLGERGVPWWEMSGDERRRRWEEALHRLDDR
ncbi:hypothetical protein H4W79_002258 [Nocardiopsis terrae]|uniref:Biopolymer transporter Tol n=1 Tax=Nocardiopsis terrae TaxID=372655 RepID=A0ABR9HG90_9ACTN|nr:hypothetical protein [Nocardiopsis terrae]MBE1458044.1 hypothetical protein [Nocardiopsis terrae]